MPACGRPTGRDRSIADARPSSSSSSSSCGSDGSGDSGDSGGRSTTETNDTIAAPAYADPEYATLLVQRLLKRRLEDELPLEMLPAARHDALTPLFATDETPEQEAVMFSEMLGDLGGSPSELVSAPANPTAIVAPPLPQVPAATDDEH